MKKLEHILDLEAKMLCIMLDDTESTRIVAKWDEIELTIYIEGISTDALGDVRWEDLVVVEPCSYEEIMAHALIEATFGNGFIAGLNLPDPESFEGGEGCEYCSEDCDCDEDDGEAE